MPDFEATKDVHVAHLKSGCKKYNDGMPVLEKVQ